MIPPSALTSALRSHSRWYALPRDLRVLVLNLPSPPYRDIGRDWAGGFGTVDFSLKRIISSKRTEYGQASSPMLQPFLPYFAAILSRIGCEFKVLDCQRLRLDQYQCLSSVKHEDPDVVVSLINLPSMRDDLALLNRVKASQTSAFVVGIGTTCRMLPGEVLLRGGVDAVLRNTYPYVSNLADLIEALPRLGRGLRKVRGLSYLHNRKVVNLPESPDLPLDEIASPSYDAIELTGYDSGFSDANDEQYRFVPILGSKGCPYPCVYCPYPAGFGKDWSAREPKEIVNEIELLYTEHRVKGFLFRDQSFTMNRKHAVRVCDEIIRRKLDIAWFCEARVNEISREILHGMKQAGCRRIHYGVETGDAGLLAMAKPGATLQNVREAFHLTKEADIWTSAHVILGWPDETLETMRGTLRFIQQLGPDSVNWNVLTPYPGTGLLDMARGNSWIVTSDWSKYTSYTVVMRTKELAAPQLDSAIRGIVHDYSRRKVWQLLRGFHRRQPRSLIDELWHYLGLYTQIPMNTI